MSLTLRALLIAAVLALAGIAGQWSPVPGIDLIWRVGAAAMVIALCYEALGIRRLHLTVSPRIRPTVFLNGNESFQLTFGKHGDERVRLQYRFSPQADFLLPDDVHGLQTGTQRHHVENLRLRPLSLGDHRLPPVNVRVLGRLGLAWWRNKQDLNTTLRVGPAYLSRAADYVGRSDTGNTAGVPVGSGLELHGLRDYRPGDPRRSIDWKATARARRLITREFTEDQHLEIMIAIDVSRTSRIRVDGLSRLGHFANVAARLSELAVQNDDKVGLLVFASEPLSMVLPGRGLPAIMRIREVLATTETQSVESSPLSAMLRLRQRIKHRCLVIVMSDLDEQAATGQLSQSLQLLMPKHSTLIVGLDNAVVSRLSSADADSWSDPYVGLAASEYILNRRAGIRQLRQRGCQVVTAPPEHLARRALMSYQALRQRHRV